MKKRSRKKKKRNVWVSIASVFAIAVSLVVIVGIVLAVPAPLSDRQTYGVTFSYPHAEGIGLDWKEVYQAVLEDLDVNALRLSAYWNTIEVADNEFDFAALDYQMDEAVKHDATVILSIGRKLPRWPECHVPGWAQELPEAQQQEQVLEMLAVVVDQYKDHPALRMWQLENEPLLSFGICPPADLEFLQREQDIVRAHDSAHPILITDSGELNSWLPAAAFGDLLGTTMYRTVFSERTERLFHYDYLFPSWAYRIKSRYVKLLRNKDVIISELQGEPWGAKPFPDMNKEERLQAFSPERFLELQRFAQRTQLPEAYWWGVEYWYLEKEVHGDPTYWQIAREIFEGKV